MSKVADDKVKSLRKRAAEYRRLAIRRYYDESVEWLRLSIKCDAEADALEAKKGEG